MTRPRLDPEEMLASATVDPTRNGSMSFAMVVAMYASYPGFVSAWAKIAGITLVEGVTPSKATTCAFIAFVHDFYWLRDLPPEGERWSNVEPFEVGL
jgi:hypothetical protein